ncbi:MAG: hypothetical protein JNK85_06085 [Verrucomicrobiales bacterium]|nr:hypothetical protein [Verrucomicrobiales bacterium]
MKPLVERWEPSNREGWRVVPSDLLALETHPAKASSDPGYYGREYLFGGDAVVETPRVLAVFGSTRGRVTLFSRGGSTGAELTRIADCSTVSGGAVAGGIVRVEMLRNAADEAILKATFAGGPSRKESETVFAFDRTGVVEIRTARGVAGVRFEAPIEFGVVPGFIGDDLVVSPSTERTAGPYHLPSENAFLGLLGGGDRELMVTWPKGRQSVRLQPGADSGSRQFGAVEVETDGQSVFVAGLAAPGLWHRQPMVAKDLEVDVKLPWKPPFPARWKVQLLEGDVRTTFTFREAKAEIWRGVPGSYTYPVWFDGEAAYLHPSKKVPPKGDAVIYFLESQGTPTEVTTPADYIKSTLGRSLAAELLDSEGRRLRTHHRRGGEGVRRACTCGCTEAIQAVFESGEEVAKRVDIEEALGDMKYFVARHLERIDEYQKFAESLVAKLGEAGKRSPELKEYLDSIKELAGRIPEECSVQKDNMKSLAHADELTRKTMALTARHDPGNVKAYMELLKAWREMGGAQDYVVAQCHMIARRIHQEAGYAAVNQPKAADAAREIRLACRQVLRNPDGYEIWDEY